MTPLFDLIVRTRCHAKCRRATVPSVCWQPPWRPTPIWAGCLTGRIAQGSLKANASVKALSRDGKVVEQARVSKILAFRGLERVSVDQGGSRRHYRAGRVSVRQVSPIPCAIPVVDDTYSSAADRPADTRHDILDQRFTARRQGRRQGHQSHDPWDRLTREAEGNVALDVSVRPDEKTVFEVAGRGELQLGVLDRNHASRRFRACHWPAARLCIAMIRIPATLLEPIEEAVIDVDDDFTGPVVEKAGSSARATCLEMRPSGGGKTRLGLPCAVAQSDRLPQRIYDRHTRYRHYEPSVTTATRPIRATCPAVASAR